MHRILYLAAIGYFLSAFSFVRAEKIPLRELLPTGRLWAVEMELVYPERRHKFQERMLEEFGKLEGAEKEELESLVQTKDAKLVFRQLGASDDEIDDFLNTRPALNPTGKKYLCNGVIEDSCWFIRPMEVNNPVLFSIDVNLETQQAYAFTRTELSPPEWVTDEDVLNFLSEGRIEGYRWEPDLQKLKQVFLGQTRSLPSLGIFRWTKTGNTLIGARHTTMETETAVEDHWFELVLVEE